MNSQLPNKKKSAIAYANFYISDYKTDRWKRRNAVIQLNKNLNNAIDLCVKALFYTNGKFCPADDRAIYYSYSLEIKPNNYESLIEKLTIIQSNSIEDYEVREKLFRDSFLSFYAE